MAQVNEIAFFHHLLVPLYCTTILHYFLTLSSLFQNKYCRQEWKFHELFKPCFHFLCVTFLPNTCKSTSILILVSTFFPLCSCRLLSRLAPFFFVSFSFITSYKSFLLLSFFPHSLSLRFPLFFLFLFLSFFSSFFSSLHFLLFHFFSFLRFKTESRPCFSYLD